MPSPEVVPSPASGDGAAAARPIAREAVAGRSGVVVVGTAAGIAAPVAAGADVVVVLPPGAPLGPRPDGPGRVAVLVGDWADEGVRALAVTMGAEVFGA